MPELPEVETIRRRLREVLLGRTVRAARLLRPDVCDPTAASTRQLLEGARITELRRRGKQLAILAGDGRALVVRLGMSGRLSLHATGKEPAHTHAWWAFDKGPRLLFVDPRRFGGLRAFASARALESCWAALGPDALDAPRRVLAAALGARRGGQSVKAALLDQARLAGVGNIYADEALFAAGVHPGRTLRSLSAGEIDALARAILPTLRRALARGGSTLRDYQNPAGLPGQAQLAHFVYGRGGEPCPRCGRTLVSLRLAGRTTTFCPSCQKARAARPGRS